MLAGSSTPALRRTGCSNCSRCAWPTSDDDAEPMFELARRLRGRPSYDVAEKLNRECLQDRGAKLGDQHPDTLASVNNLADLLKDQGRYEEAEQLHRQALEGCRAKLGDQHRETLVWMNNLAVLLEAQGRHEDAEQLHRQTLEVRRIKLGDPAPRDHGVDEQLGCTLGGSGAT